jgi:hypothetical protein
MLYKEMACVALLQHSWDYKFRFTMFGRPLKLVKEVRLAVYVARLGRKKS